MQEAFNVLTRYDVAVDREYFDQVDSLRGTFNNLLSRALQVQVQLLGKSDSENCSIHTLSVFDLSFDF